MNQIVNIKIMKQLILFSTIYIMSPVHRSVKMVVFLLRGPRFPAASTCANQSLNRVITITQVIISNSITELCICVLFNPCSRRVTQYSVIVRDIIMHVVQKYTFFSDFLKISKRGHFRIYETLKNVFLVHWLWL